MIDCDLLSKVYINLIDQKEPMLNFKKNDNNSSDNISCEISYFKKIVTPTPEEIKEHKIYLNTQLKKNYF